jgi:RND family efflux transporter MFP subunit
MKHEGQVRWLAMLAGVILGSFVFAPRPSRAQGSSFLGKVTPLSDHVTDVVAPATGKILAARERPFLVGDRVKKGDPLDIISNQYDLHDASHLSTARWDFEKVVIDTRYQALQARIAREKGERLKAAGSMTGQQVADLKAAEQVAQAEYLRQKSLLDQQDSQIKGDQLERRGLFAPIDGEIALANFTQGQTVYEGFLLYRIVNLKQVGVTARVPESVFEPWPQGTPALIRFDDLPGRVFAGKLEATFPSVDPAARTRDVLFRVENPGELLRFGMLGHVEIKAPSEARTK